MRTQTQDSCKSLAQLRAEVGKFCKICALEGVNEPLTHLKGPGSKTLCRKHQLALSEYGEFGRIDRPHTFHREWKCPECGYTPLTDPRISDVQDEMDKRRIARILMHGDHGTRRTDGGNDSEQNINCLCYVCHAKKTVLNKDYLKRNTKVS